MSIFSRFIPWTDNKGEKPPVILRTDLAHDPLLDAAQTLAAFSPDIIPVGSTEQDRADIVNSYALYIAHPLIAEGKNNVWIRARHSGPSDAQLAPISLLVAENELLLWPQAWAGVPQVGAAKFREEKGLIESLLVADEPIVVPGKKYEDGRHAMLVALYDEGMTRATTAASNWRQLVNTMGAHKTLAALNVLTVSPVEEHVTLVTRLRVFEDERDHVDMRLSLEAVGIPKNGIEAGVVIFSQAGEVMYTLERTAVIPASTGPGIDLHLPRDFDGMVHVEVFKEQGVLISDYASVSVVATVINEKGVTTLLGAEHIVFDSSIALKEFLDVKAEEWVNPPFWLRGRVGDGPPPNKSRNGTSPDIQPAGMRPDPDAITTYGSSNWSIDVSRSRKVPLYANASNYIYGRFETSRPVSAMARLYCVPSNMLQFPTKYFKFEVKDSFMGSSSTYHEETAFRGFSSLGPSKVVVPLPFNHFKPPPSSAMSPGSSHYCLVMEAAEGVDPSNPSRFTAWPHQSTLNTWSTFAAWMLNEPRVAYRNMTYDSGTNKNVIVKQTALTVQESFDKTQPWVYSVSVRNAPIGSEIETVAQLVGYGQPINQEDLSMPARAVRNANPTFNSDQFQGVGNDFNVVFTTYWRAKGKPVPRNLDIKLTFQNVSNKTSFFSKSMARHTTTPPPGVGLVVGREYPLFKAEVKGMRTSLVQGYTGIRGAMHAYDAPGKISASEASPHTAQFVWTALGDDTLAYDQ